MTLAEVGEILHITRERVRQLEAKGFVRLIRSKFIKDLAIYAPYPNQASQKIEELESQEKEKGEGRRNVKNTNNIWIL